MRAVGGTHQSARRLEWRCVSAWLQRSGFGRPNADRHWTNGSSWLGAQAFSSATVETASVRRRAESVRRRRVHIGFSNNGAEQ